MTFVHEYTEYFIDFRCIIFVNIYVQFDALT